MRSLGHGPGFRFHPTDEELTMYYLKKKVTGTEFHHDGIQEIDVYNLDPGDLKVGDYRTRDRIWYFFCRRERKYPRGKRTKRCTTNGFWKITGNDRNVSYNGENVGIIKSLIFYKRDPPKRTDWVMHEYQLRDEYLKKLGFGENVFVLCVIFEKEGPGPRNGAQYGAPYKEEDWDDVNDEQDNHGFGSLTQVHDSTDKGKSTVPNDLDWADRCGVGSSSWTLPSDIDQSVNHAFLPTPVPGTLLVDDSQLPLNDEYGMFSHEVLLASLGCERAQDIDVDRDVNCEPTILANEENIYGDSERLRGLKDFPDSGVGGHDNDSLANQDISLDNIMELNDILDFSGPCPEHPIFFGLEILDDILSQTFVGPQHSDAWISDITPSWNGLHHEPCQADLLINGTQTGLNLFRSGDSGSSELRVPYLDQHSPVSKGSMRFNAQGSGGYGPFRQHPQFSDGLGDPDFGDNVLYSNHLQLTGGPIGFGGHGFGENQLYWNPHHQFAQGPNGLVGQSFRENVTSFHGLQFAKDLAGLGGQVSGENVQHSNQHHQTADGSTGFCGQEMS